MGSGLMAFDAGRLLGWDFGEQTQTYDARDTILYALGVGLPLAPGESDDLNFLVEDRLRVLPAFSVVLATPGMWPKIPELGIDWVKVLHMAHAVRFDAPLPPEASVKKPRPDRRAVRPRAGQGRGLHPDAAGGRPRQRHRLLHHRPGPWRLRGNGGFGGDPMPRTARPGMPDRAPDHRENITTSERARADLSAVGRLQPAARRLRRRARAAGFDRPILHGLASYGTACAVVLRAFCGGDPARMLSLDMRFAGIVMPGDRLEFTCWKEADRVLFEARVDGRTVLDQGVSQIAP